MFCNWLLTAHFSSLHPTAAYVDGAAEASRFSDIKQIALDIDGSLVISDAGNRRIRRLENGRVRTIAGDGSNACTDGVATAASFMNPTGLASVSKWVYVLDVTKIRCISPDGTVTTIAGTHAAGYADGNGLNALLSPNANSPLAMDGNGNFAFVGQKGARLRQFQ